MTTAEWIVTGLGLYLAAGLVFAVFFVLFFLGRVDPTAKDAKLTVRLLFIPGAVGLWPLLILRVISPGREETM